MLDRARQTFRSNFTTIVDDNDPETQSQQELTSDVNLQIKFMAV